MDKSAIHTARYADFADKRFDSFNARRSSFHPLVKYKPLSQVVTDTSPHLQFWKKTLQEMESMRYVSKDKKIPLANPPSFQNWKHNLRYMPELWKVLKNKGFSHMKSGYVNQDTIENFFGNMRSYGLRYNTPTCFQTEGLLKALMVSNLTSKHSIGANCLDDEATPLASLGTFAAAANFNTESSGTRSHEFDEQSHSEKVLHEKWSSLRVASRVQSAGILAKMVLSGIEGLKNCDNCQKVFFCDDARSNDNVSLLRQNHLEAINVAAANYFERGFTRAVNLVNRQLPLMCWKRHLRKVLTQFLRERMDFEWVTCLQHRTVIAKRFNECIVVNCILKWCIHINRILTGQIFVTKGSSMEIRAHKKYLATQKRKTGIKKQ